MADPTVAAFLYTNPGKSNTKLVIKELKVEMHPYAHNLAKITMQNSDDTKISQWDTGTPVLISYGRRPTGMTNFYGYMLTPQPTFSQTLRASPQNRLMTIWAMGTSYPMLNGLSQSFSNKTAAQMVKSVAGAHYLDIYAPVSAADYVWPMKNALNGESQWQFLTELAKASGRTCHMIGTQLAFYDSATLLTSPAPTVPTFYEKDSGKGMTVLGFTADNSELSVATGRQKRTRVLQSITSSGTPVSLTHNDAKDPHYYGARYRTPLFTEYVSGLVAHTQNAATTLLPARTLENRFYLRAEATLAGNVRVTQQSPIVIEGLGVRDSGLWQVLSVTHHVKWQYYALECELGRDSDFDNGVRPSNRPGIDRAYLASTAVASAAVPPTILSNGQWRAAYYSARG